VIVPAFARHETFHPRIGWLPKAVQAVERDPAVFSDKNATVTLGVGKNMVHAIRYWAAATKVVAESETRGEMKVTPLGRYLLAESGVDQYAEDPATLWLLHWSLLSEPVTAPTWWWVFNDLDLVDFGHDDMLRGERDWIATFEWAKITADTSLLKDLDCLIRMYTRRDRTADIVESQFASLGLMEAVPGNSKRWRFIGGPKESLDPRLVLLTSLLSMHSWTPESQTVSVARLNGQPGGPGRAFRLTEASMANALRVAADDLPTIEVISTAGLPQLIVKADKQAVISQLLDEIYGRRPEDDVVDQLVGGEPSLESEKAGVAQ
jgi:hypothetical protein